MSSPKRSCASRLHNLQKDFGLSNKELKDAVRDISRPREVELPTFHEKTSKKERKLQDSMRPGSKKRRYFIAHWYLEKYLEPFEAEKVYMTYLNFKELVAYAYEKAMDLIQLMTFRIETDLDPDTMFPYPADDELDIPDIHWKEFGAYCKKHPLKKAKDIFVRRRKFKKYLRKRRDRYYSRKRMRMYDPLFAMTTTNKKEMIDNIKRITKENELRVKKFKDMLGSLYKDKSIGSIAMKKFSEQTEEIMKQHRRRMRSFMKQHNLQPSPITFDYDDRSLTFT